MNINICYKEPHFYTFRKCHYILIFIPHEIIDIIMKKLERYEDKNNFCMINSFIYKNYHNIVKIYILEKYINKDYIKFYNLLQIYEYEKADNAYLKKMFIKCISKPPTIWINDYMGYADLRFIFEFIYHYDIMNDMMNDFIMRRSYLNIDFFKDIEKCIVKNNRLLTLKNIENATLISSLKKTFNPCSHKNHGTWVKLFN